MSPHCILKISNLSFSYDDKPILNAIDCTVMAGEYVSLIGPNGAGKSTLLKCLNRILKFSVGTIELCNKDLHSYRQKDLARMVGYVPQMHEQVFPYTVYEFVLMGRYPYLKPFAHPGAADERIVQETLARIGLERFAARPVRSLSGGERQKVFLAAALAQQPKVLLLDEPTAHLDPKHHVEIQRIIRQVAREFAVTVVHVTHDLNDVAGSSHKVIALKEGRVQSFGVPAEILTKENLRDIFGTAFVFIPFPGRNYSLMMPE